MNNIEVTKDLDHDEINTLTERLYVGSSAKKVLENNFNRIMIKRRESSIPEAQPSFIAIPQTQLIAAREAFENAVGYAFDITADRSVLDHGLMQAAAFLQERPTHKVTPEFYLHMMKEKETEITELTNKVFDLKAIIEMKDREIVNWNESYDLMLRHRDELANKVADRNAEIERLKKLYGSLAYITSLEDAMHAIKKHLENLGRTVAS